MLSFRDTVTTEALCRQLLTAAESFRAGMSASKIWWNNVYNPVFNHEDQPWMGHLPLLLSDVSLVKSWVAVIRMRSEC